ncbi:MAG TPA: indole-3-glycerol phosphate synthase TrpC [Solirubrobacterales bacterium]|nr:indole-3-glycerol phosphate synthase TrpC [Solirubrobacterales bacterium]
MGALDDITRAVRDQVERRKEQVSLAELERAMSGRREGRPFNEALAAPGMSVIAEFKRRSPAAGDLPRGSDPVEDIVRAYERGGAAALSILTESEFFGGSIADLRAARATTDLPILRKDFTIDRYQLFEAAAVQADAVLLIVAVLERDELEQLHAEARQLDLDCLVEVHDAEELEAALELDADVIGINNRNLSDFTVDVATTFELLSDVPAGKTVVSESGIRSRQQIEELEQVGVDAVLVGETLMSSEDPEAACRELAGAEEATTA